MRQTETTSFNREKLRSHPKWRWRRIINSWPFFAWLAVVLVAVLFYLKSVQFGSLAGSVQCITHDISPLHTARVKELCVKIGDSVTNGQILAQMDTTLMDAQLAEAQASLSAAQGSWASYDAQMLNLSRAVEDDIASAQAAIEQQKKQKESDGAKLSELKSMQGKRDELFKNKLITEIEDDALRPEIAALQNAVAAIDPILALSQQTLERRIKDRASLRQSLRLGADEDIAKALALKTEARAAILKSALEMRLLEKEAYTLRAPTNGLVSDITVFSGSTASAETAVVKLVSSSRLIIGYLPEIRRTQLKLGDEGYAFRLTQPPLRVRITAFAPDITRTLSAIKPISAAQQSGITFRAQRVVFEALGNGDLTPGESVQIRLDAGWWTKVKAWFSQ